MANKNSAGLGAILLAAGGSSRLGHPKQLLDIEGEALVVRQARLLLGVKPACVVVVTGAMNEEIEARLQSLSVSCVHNPEWELGMGASLARGIGAMPERVRAALVLLCDQWKVNAESLESLVDAWAESPQCAVVADDGDAIGPPAILPRSMFERLSRLEGDTGAKRILKRWKGEVRTVAMPEAAPDIDEPGDLVR
jgi:molybdenum cofactor cytidylyltransferase